MREEEALYPGQPAWATTRRKAAVRVQENFLTAIGSGSPENAEPLLKQQEKLIDEYELDRALIPLDDNKTTLKDLFEKTLPAPLKRDYGQVYGAIRLGGEYAIGRKFSIDADFQGGGSSELSFLQGRAGVTWFVSPNMGLGLHVLYSDIQTDDMTPNGPAQVDSTAFLVGPSILIQF